MSPLHHRFFVSFPPLFLMLAALACGSSSSAPPQLDGSPPDTPSETSSEASPDAGNDSGDATQDPSTQDAASHRFAMLVGSDFASTAELSVLDLDTNQLVGRLTSNDQDTVAAASLGRGFLLHRTQGKVSVLDRKDPSVEQFVLDVTPTQEAGKANPYSVVVAAEDRGYVIRYGHNGVPVVDLSTGIAQTTIDLSQFVADPDNLVDAFDGVYDASKARLYIGLQRINQNEFGPPPDYVSACSSNAALVIGIDVATMAVVDLNGSAPGLGIELKSANPSAMVWDEASRSIIMLGVGCAGPDVDGGTTRNGRGLERVNVDVNQTEWLWESHQLDRPSALVWLPDQTAVIGLDDASFARHWWLLAKGATAFTKALLGVPMVPAHDATGGLVGLVPTPGDAGAGWDIVRYNVATDSHQVVFSNAFSAAGLSAYSSAVIR